MGPSYFGHGFKTLPATMFATTVFGLPSLSMNDNNFDLTVILFTRIEKF